MSGMEKAVRFQREEELHAKKHPVVNFMGGTSYEWNPLDTLKLVTASSIFGEPSYYRDGAFADSGIARVIDGAFHVDGLFTEYILPCMKDFEGVKTSQIMERVIDEALTCDFEATLKWAETLRHEYFMRLNPQVIMVRAACHPGREAFTAKHPGEFARINDRVMSRADEPASQLMYYLYSHKSKKQLPGLLKRSWAARIGKMSRYELYKYRNTGIGLIDTVRVCHAKGELVDELMRTGTVALEEGDATWEALRSAGKSWHEILGTIRLGHMALLRNLRGIFAEISDRDETRRILQQLKDGVPYGKQFPFRYKSAWDAVNAERSNLHHAQMILDALEDCIDIACDNMPHLKGRTVCLSDNSGSAWGAFTSEYGSVTVAKIDNLSSVITARNSDEGSVGKFGDELKMIDVSHRGGVLHQAEAISADRYEDVGGSTENGVWLFFDEAIKNKIVYDHIFIYSDMQAGHGGLYGTSQGKADYSAKGYACRGSSRYIDVAKLIDAYRRKVNPKVNVFCVQTAGYSNVLVPENGYRTSILYGWTGRELVYADAINRFWDEKDAQREAGKQ